MAVKNLYFSHDSYYHTAHKNPFLQLIKTVQIYAKKLLFNDTLESLALILLKQNGNRDAGDITVIF